ncbi:MAG: hypothetical protein ACI82H_001415, partial [Alphaproteobacteria bacterium]
QRAKANLLGAKSAERRYSRSMTTMTAAIHRQSRMHRMQRLTHAVLALALATALMGTLSACGKRGAPEPLPGQKDEYPRNYPDPSTYRPL